MDFKCKGYYELSIMCTSTIFLSNSKSIAYLVARNQITEINTNLFYKIAGLTTYISLDSWF